MNSRNNKSRIRQEQKQSNGHSRLLTASAPSFNRDRAKGLFEEGKAELGERNYKEAEKLFGLAMYYDSGVSLYHFYQGLAMVKHNAYKDAESAFERAHALEPENADYAAELGLVCLELGFPERAKSFFKAALRAMPGHDRAVEGIKRINPKKCPEL